MAYAEKTEVSAEKSRAEIERILSRYGASAFGYMTGSARAVIAFEADGRRLRFDLPLPAKEEFRRAPGKWNDRSDTAMQNAYEQAVRTRWRALCLCIKAKLGACESGITTFEDEFLAHIVLPNGQTMGQLARPQIALSYERGEVPPLLISHEPS